ncbi:hypothetical protein ACIBI3_04760 [Actinomadura luteofluorescens]|uniref:hypothetical protein n=1 Tax=Actinomadura luteofluorescens TaxID=46163 RepID=UPI00347DDD18
MTKRFDVATDSPVHLDDVTYEALEEARASGEPVTVAYGGAEIVVKPDTKDGPSAITGRLLDAAGR